ncbi:hypothetical protein [cf. Phormidesmis sp. LEGE 11477]|nr:hypothetical protein [cf. Phormidesmis sp. LEGE 11477]MBE9061630.1 hypothetical protein [cf. Phormidesmis sp. LEGE 11477]
MVQARAIDLLIMAIRIGYRKGVERHKNLGIDLIVGDPQDVKSLIRQG